MGYHTFYSGELTIEPALTPEHLEILRRLIDGSEDVFSPLPKELQEIAGELQGVLSEPVALTADTLNFQGEGYWDFKEQFENLIARFFKPREYFLTGDFDWSGDDDSDHGTVYVKDNQIEWVEDIVTNPGPSWDRAGVEKVQP